MTSREIIKRKNEADRNQLNVARRRIAKRHAAMIREHEATKCLRGRGPRPINPRPVQQASRQKAPGLVRRVLGRLFGRRGS